MTKLEMKSFTQSLIVTTVIGGYRMPPLILRRKLPNYIKRTSVATRHGSSLWQTRRSIHGVTRDMSEKETGHGDVRGDYNTVDGIKERAVSLGNPDVADLIEAAENRILEEEDGYVIGCPDPDDVPPSYGLQMLFHLGILTGAAMEREYPAPVEGDLDG